jgi:hypothetical protein
LGAKLSDETKRKIGAKSKARKRSKEEIEKIRTSLKRRYESQSHHSKGTKLTEEHKRKVGEAFKGKILTEEHKRKISDGRKRHYQNDPNAYRDGNPGPRSDEFRRKLSKAHTSKKLSEETKRKIGEANKGRKHTEESKLKMSRVQTGRIVSPEARRKLSEAHSGKTLTDEHKDKIGEAFTGDKNHQWIDGRSCEPYTSEFNGVLKREIRRRDNETCQACFADAKGDKGNVHHRNADKTDCRPENLILVCDSCHSLIHHSTKDTDNEMILKFRGELT